MSKKKTPVTSSDLEASIRWLGEQGTGESLMQLSQLRIAIKNATSKGAHVAVERFHTFTAVASWLGVTPPRVHQLVKAYRLSLRTSKLHKDGKKRSNTT